MDKYFDLSYRPEHGVYADWTNTGLPALQNITEAGLLKKQNDRFKREGRDAFSWMLKWRQDYETQVDGQLALNDRVELLGALLDYGATYMDALKGFNKSGLMPFNKQIGPMKGCTLLDGGKLRLNEAGQWNIFAQITVDWLPILDPNVWLISRVRDPQGHEYSVKEVRDASNWVMTLSAVHPVVIPEPNYTVEIEAKFSVVRKVLGGPARNHLVAQHISNQAGHVNNVNEALETSEDLQQIVTRPPDTWSDAEWILVADSAGKTVDAMKQEARDQGYQIP